MPDDCGKPTLAIGFAISDDPAPADEELEQNGLRIFVQDTLVEPLDGRTLNVRERRRWARTDLSLAVRATASLTLYRASVGAVAQKGPAAPTPGGSLPAPTRRDSLQVSIAHANGMFYNCNWKKRTIVEKRSLRSHFKSFSEIHHPLF